MTIYTDAKYHDPCHVVDLTQELDPYVGNKSWGARSCVELAIYIIEWGFRKEFRVSWFQCSARTRNASRKL